MVVKKLPGTGGTADKPFACPQGLHQQDNVLWDFPGGQVADSTLPMQRAQEFDL